MTDPIDGGPNINGHPTPTHATTPAPEPGPAPAPALPADLGLGDAVSARSPSSTYDGQPRAHPSPDLLLHQDHLSDTDRSSSPPDASDDADFDMEASSLSQRHQSPVQDRAISSDSSTSPKRKAPITMAEEDYIKANPELYGLRRSVSLAPPLLLRLYPPSFKTNIHHS